VRSTLTCCQQAANPDQSPEPLGTATVLAFRDAFLAPEPSTEPSRSAAATAAHHHTASFRTNGEQTTFANARRYTLQTGLSGLAATRAAHGGHGRRRVSRVRNVLQPTKHVPYGTDATGYSKRGKAVCDSNAIRRMLPRAYTTKSRSQTPDRGAICSNRKLGSQQSSDNATATAAPAETVGRTVRT